MTSSFIPDYNPGDDSFRVGGTIRTDQGMPAMMLDRVLTGFSPGSTPATPTEALDALRGFLSQTPLEVLQMFKPFVFKTDVDWDDQYGAVEGIMGTFRPKSFKDWVADFELKTGLEIDSGAQKFFESLNAKLKENHLDWVTDFEAKTKLNVDEGVVKFLESLRDVQKANRLDWITDFEAKSGLDIDSGAAAFLASLLVKLRPTLDGKADLNALMQEIADRKAEVAAKREEARKEFADWLTNTFAPWRVTQEDREKAWQDWLDRIFTPWHDRKDSWQATVDAWKAASDARQDAREQAWNDWLNKVFTPWHDGKDAWQSTLDAWKTATDGWKTASDARQDARQKAWQDFLDGVVHIFDPSRPAGSPIADAIAAILGIKTRAELAQEAADRANMGVASLRAEQKGGKSDEFNYASATTLPTVEWKMSRFGPTSGTNAALTWGPDGSGSLVYQPNGIAGLGQADIIYRWLTYHMPGTTGYVMTQLFKPPSTLVSLAGTSVGSFFICWHMNATNAACNRFEITQDKAQLQRVDAAGVATNVGAAVTIPKCATGDQFAVQWDDGAGKVQLLRVPVGFSAAVTILDTTYTPATGDFVGLGAHCPIFTGTATINNPCPGFAGITAHP